MSIESSLVKLADKIDAQGASDVQPDYKNPNQSIERSIDRIADHYEAGGGGGGGVLVVIADEPMASPPSWVTELFDGYRIYETNVTYAQYHEAFTSNVLGLSTPANSEIFYRNRSQMIAEFMDFGFIEEISAYTARVMVYKYFGGFSQIELSFIANAEDGMLYCAIESEV